MEALIKKPIEKLNVVSTGPKELKNVLEKISNSKDDKIKGMIHEALIRLEYFFYNMKIFNIFFKSKHLQF